MAEPLKNHYGRHIPETIAGMICAVYPDFPAVAFMDDVLKEYDSLELMSRGRHIARALRRHLPKDYTEAAEILMASLGPPFDKIGDNGMSPFLYLPHVFFVAEFGLGHFAISMRAQHALTQRFTAEFSIRAYLEHHQDATLKMLRDWASDPSPHVRRLVSEGTRPRLPWAPRLKNFQRDPTPVLALLELLKDDPELYVRRSVANNLNDIGKDHPDLLVATAKAWLVGASPQRVRLVRHALRSAIKNADAAALSLLGYTAAPGLVLREGKISPKRIPIGASTQIAFSVQNTGSKTLDVLVDFRVHFIKANGQASPKVFKLTALTLAAGETKRLSKSISLAVHTTRKPFPGRHAVDVLLNGVTTPLGTFEVHS